MSVIYKYELSSKQLQEIEMPVGAKIISVAAQFERICIWAIVDRFAPSEKRKFAAVMTGFTEFDEAEMQYLGTVQLQGGNLVVHVFTEASHE